MDRAPEPDICESCGAAASEVKRQGWYRTLWATGDWRCQARGVGPTYVGTARSTEGVNANRLGRRYALPSCALNPGLAGALMLLPGEALHGRCYVRGELASKVAVRECSASRCSETQTEAGSRHHGEARYSCKRIRA